MTEKRVMKLASRGKRFGAACIDAFIPLVSYLMTVAVLAANGININPYYPGYGYGFGNGFGYGYGYGFGYGLGSRRLGGASAAILAVVFIILIAYIVAEFVLYSKGKTIGKAILGMQVVSSTDGKPFRFWKMLFRECFVKGASSSVFCLGYVWILIDEKNRGWHDKILDSYVVDLKESERINYRRHIESMNKAAAAPEPVQEVAEPVIRGVRETEETAAAVIAETVPEVNVELAEAAEPVIEEKVTEETDAEEHVTEETAAEGQSADAEEAVTEEAAAEEAVADTKAEEKPDIPALSMSMKKEELLEAARERGVQVSARATKTAIIEAIEKAAAETEE